MYAKTHNSSRQAGFSVMESVLYILLLVVGVIALLATFTNAFASTKVQVESGYMQDIVSEVQGMYATNRDYGTDDITSVLIASKAAPAPMIVGSTLRNSWNGVVTVRGSSDSFAIQTTNVPKKECIKLSQISINPSTITINSSGMPIPLTPAAAISACKNDVNLISWNVR